MKKRTHLFFVLMIFAAFGFAQSTVSVSGIVTDIETGGPAEGQQVFILSDSANAGGYLSIVLTNEFGEYADSFDVPEQSEGMLSVFTFDCNGQTFFEDRFFGPENYTFTVDFAICTQMNPGDCYADFWYNHTDSLTVEFQDLSWPDPSSWFWDFGDGQTSEEQNPLHQYDVAGIYPVMLTVTVDETACTSTTVYDVYVGNAFNDCFAWYIWYPTWEEPLGIQFQDVSVFEPGSYLWNFGDGAISTEASPMHVFAEEGEYEVSLTIFSADSSCTDTYSEIIFVEEYNVDCHADFWYYPVSGSTIQFEDFSFPDPETWAWDFGDGFTSVEQSPLHTYELAGVYNVCLTITNDAANCEDTRCYEVFVDSSGFIDCHANFWYYQTDSLYVEFQDFSYPNPSSWLWDFGDGEFSEEQNPVHQYAEEGVYPVTLTITVDETGCSSVVSYEVWVYDINNYCEAYFYWYDGNEPLSLSFYDLSVYQGDVEYFWDFGDNNISNEQNPVHTYSEEGEYEVCLTISKPDTSCFSTFCQTVYVGNGFPGECQSNFVVSVLGDLSYQFEGFFVNGTTEGDFFWDFGDGNIGFGPSVEHTYEEGGPYVVCLSTLSYSNPADSCIWISCQDLIVGGGNLPMAAAFTMVQDSLNPMMMHFYDVSTGGPEGWLWEFGDGHVSNEQHPVHEFSTPGYFNVCLTIFGQGMTDVQCQQIEMASASVSIPEFESGFSAGEVYPNPNNGIFSITLNTSMDEPVDVRLINYVGQTVYRNDEFVAEGSQKIEISVSGLSGGIYSLIIQSGENKIVRKLVIR